MWYTVAPRDIPDNTDIEPLGSNHFPLVPLHHAMNPVVCNIFLLHSTIFLQPVLPYLNYLLLKIQDLIVQKATLFLHVRFGGLGSLPSITHRILEDHLVSNASKPFWSTPNQELVNSMNGNRNHVTYAVLLSHTTIIYLLSLHCLLFSNRLNMASLPHTVEAFLSYTNFYSALYILLP